jgi:hypothetical protein
MTKSYWLFTNFIQSSTVIRAIRIFGIDVAFY